jgi:DnaJ-class molecular chaperone
MAFDWYEELGVSKGATTSELKQAYLIACKAWHPDKWSSKSIAEQSNAEKKFKVIQQAYCTLNEHRAAYDLRFGEGKPIEGGGTSCS